LTVANAICLTGFHRGLRGNELTEFIEKALENAKDGAIDLAGLDVAHQGCQLGRFQTYQILDPEIKYYVRR
jgi:hypothetical protein